MSSELNLVTQLAIILISAGIFTVISKALKQPLILGYIVAGFIVGPHLGLFPQFSPESVHEWSELGIIFLLFGLGLEFNFKKLLNVGSAAMISAVTICIGMFLTGSALGSILGWSSMESIFLGGMMSMSSTTIIIKAYDDLGIKNKPYATLVFGLLVVEDLLAVLMMVLFSTLAVSKQFSGADMLLSLAKLVAFLVLCFLVGIFVLPSLLKRASKYISDEILLLISIGLCFLMVVLANMVGFSSALGAFLMGSILSSTIEGERIEHITGNIKNLFGAIFFVSVGMMVDPAVIAQYWSTILIITVVAMLGILIFSTTGVLLSGKSLNTALHVGFSLPQLGEFSFIIAGLGCTLGVLRDFIYPVIISVSVITTFTTPYMIKAADPVTAWVHRILPEKVKERINRRASSSNMSAAEENTWKTFLKKYLLRIALYSMILVVLLIGMREYFPQLANNFLPDLSQSWRNVIMIATALVIMSPFLYGLAVNGGVIRTLADEMIAKNPKNKVPLMVAIVLRIVLAVMFAISAILIFTNLTGWKFGILFIALALIFIFARRASKRFTRIEDRFFANLREKEEYNKRKAPVSTLMHSKLEGYDIHIKAVTVLSDFIYAGKTLREMPFRHTSGVNIVKIQRGSKSILIPKGDELVLPGDLLLAVGTNEQLDLFTKYMVENSVVSKPVTEEFNVEQVEVTEDSNLNGKVLKDTDMRPSGCMVVSVERDGVLHTNPDKDFKFRIGDILWMAGLQSSINWYKA
jgi:Kef-type K+ transport systems, membrane components